MPAERLKQAIKDLSVSIKDNEYLLLAALNAFLFFYDQESQEVGDQDKQRKLSGLHLTEFLLKKLIEYLATQKTWPEIKDLSSLANYAALREIIIRKRGPGTGREAERYYLFVSCLLVFLISLADDNDDIRRSKPYEDFLNFHAEEHIFSLFSNDLTTPQPYIFPNKFVLPKSLGEMLRTELHIENLNDRDIADFFHLPEANEPAKFICYRYTTRQNSRKNIPNSITRSYLEIYKPGVAEVFNFKHWYLDPDGEKRRTTGFLVHLAQSFYFVGSSRREGTVFSAAKAMKVIAVTNKESTRYQNGFIAGLYLSNDSQLNPITGRILLVRAKDEIDYETTGLFDRFPEEKIMTDLKEKSLQGQYLKQGDKTWLLDMIRNYDVKWAKKNIQSSLVAHRVLSRRS